MIDAHSASPLKDNTHAVERKTLCAWGVFDYGKRARTKRRESGATPQTCDGVATHVVVASSTTIPTATTAASVAAAAPARLPAIAAATFEREDVDRRGRGVIIKGLILMREATLCASIAAWGGWFTVAAHCGVGKTQTTTPANRQAARGGAGDAVSTRVSHCTCDVCVSCLCVCCVCAEALFNPSPPPFCGGVHRAR